MATAKKEEVKIEEVKIEEIEVATVAETAPSEVEDKKELDEDAKKWGKELAKQKKVRIKIKSLGKKDVGAYPVGINGYFYFIPKDVYVEVPKSVADILEEAEVI